jgi:hypothetical protein
LPAEGQASEHRLHELCSASRAWFTAEHDAF